MSPDTSFLWKKRKNYYVPINYNFKKRPRKQDVEFYKENGAIYITRTKVFIKNNNRLGGKIGIYNMNKQISIDIDNLNDFRKAEQLMKSK